MEESNSMPVKAKKETLGFQSEAKQLLHLMIHSLYSNKEIFLRELISNASDAIDRLRFESLSNENLLESDGDLKVWVDVDKEAKTISVTDNGIGLSREEAISHLGTIAKSGTSQFLKSLTGDQKKDAQLIGQFGVGFYSSFIVADKVVVESRRAGDPEDEAVRWVSEGESEFEVETVSRDRRGTSVTLHLKPDETEFADSWRLKNIVKKYADHVSVPVVMKKEPLQTSDTEKDKDDDKKQAEPEEEVVNTAKALWTRSRKDISDDEYQEFYKHVSHDFQDPLTWSHNKVEGKLDYTALIYIPAKAPFDLWQREAPRGLKLYVQRVFIMDDAEQFLPLYLRFVKGVVDSNDLSLNVSREILQKDPAIDSMRSALTKRVLDMLEKLAKNKPEDYLTFWKEFGQAMKEGPAEDYTNREKIAGLLRFATTKSASSDQDQSLADYVSRMQEDQEGEKSKEGEKGKDGAKDKKGAKGKKGKQDKDGEKAKKVEEGKESKEGEEGKNRQEKIYYIAADNYQTAINSPHLEVFKKKNIEVLLLTDRIDEWLMSHLMEFDGKQFVDVSKGELDLKDIGNEEDEARKKKAEKASQALVKRIKEIMKDQVEDVRVTDRLTGSPACLVVSADDMGMQMRRIMESAGQDVPKAKRIFEINVEHPLVQKLDDETDMDRFSDLSLVLYDQAVLAEGSQLEDPAAYVNRLNKLLLELSG